MAQPEPETSEKDAAAKRQPETLLELLPPIKKPKPSVLHVIVKLLEDLQKEEVPQLQALLTARMNLDGHISHKSSESERQGRNATRDTQTSKEKVPSASPFRQFGNSASEALHLGLNIDKAATSADAKSKTNDGIAREKAVISKNGQFGNNFVGVVRSNTEGEYEMHMGDGDRYQCLNKSMKPVKNSEYMVNSRKPQTAIANAHKEVEFSQFISQALQNKTSAKAKMNNPDYVAFQHSQCQFRELQTTEGVKKIWDVQSTSFVGTYLLG